MSASAWALQKAIFTALTGDAILMAMIEAVHDHVPENADFPYVTIGEDSVEEFGAKTFVGARHTLALHVWSRARGRLEAKDVIARLRAVLDGAALTLVGQTLVDLRFVGEETMLDDDRLTYHGIARFRALTQEN